MIIISAMFLHTFLSCVPGVGCTIIYAVLIINHADTMHLFNVLINGTIQLLYPLCIGVCFHPRFGLSSMNFYLL